MSRTVAFAREQLRALFTLALLIAIPALFVLSAAGVLSDSPARSVPSRSMSRRGAEGR